MHMYPHTIENGSGESLTFLGVVRDQDGERLEVEARAQPGAGPPMHVHHLREEAMTVVSGTLGFSVLLVLGTILGKYDKFKDAPEPVLEAQAGSRHSTSAV